jgi:hypothetical protein
MFGLTIQLVILVVLIGGGLSLDDMINLWYQMIEGV